MPNPSWTRGADVINDLIRKHHLDQVSGASADGRGLLDEVETLLGSAATLQNSDPRMAYIAAYDAARFALTALLTQQGLRPTSAGGHIGISEAVRAQFGSGFTDFDYLRRRRNELEYPQPNAPQSAVTSGEVATAISDARTLADSARQLIDQLGFFGS